MKLKPENRSRLTEGNEENEEGRGWNFHARNLSDGTTPSRKPFSFVAFVTFCESYFGVRVKPDSGLNDPGFPASTGKGWLLPVRILAERYRKIFPRRVVFQKYRVAPRHGTHTLRYRLLQQLGSLGEGVKQATEIATHV